MTRVSEPAVSVCIPVFNGEAFLAQTIESVLSQTFEDFELVVLDNASTDRTPQIIAGFRDARLRTVRHGQNIGASANHQSGLQLARAPWVKLVGADDLLKPHCLARQVEQVTALSSRGVVLVTCARDIVDDAGRRWMTRWYPGGVGRIEGPGAVRRCVRSGTNLLGEPVAALIHRQTALDVGGFDPKWRFCTDLDLWVRMLRMGDVVVDPEPLCSFRVSGRSWSVALMAQQASEFRGWIRELRKEHPAAATSFDAILGNAQARRLMLQRWAFYLLLTWRRMLRQ